MVAHEIGIDGLEAVLSDTKPADAYPIIGNLTP